MESNTSLVDTIHSDDSTSQPQLKQCVSGGVELVITTQSPSTERPTIYSPGALPENPEPNSDCVTGSPNDFTGSLTVAQDRDQSNSAENTDSTLQHGSRSSDIPPVSNSVENFERGSQSSCVQHESEIKVSTAQDLIRPSSLPVSPVNTQTPTNIPDAVINNVTDVANIAPPASTSHHLPPQVHVNNDAMDSVGSASSSPVPGKVRVKRKKKKQHSSRSSPRSSPLMGGMGSLASVASPLTNQIGPVVSGSGSSPFPSMSQLVNEISVLDTKQGGESSLGSMSGRITSAQIDTEMMQIDSILRALNTGTLDEGNMATIQQLTEQRPQVWL